jgi:hypothetical protein
VSEFEKREQFEVRMVFVGLIIATIFAGITLWVLPPPWFPTFKSDNQIRQIVREELDAGVVSPASVR